MPFSLLFCHETPPLTLSSARLSEGPRPPPHYVSVSVIFTVVEILSVVTSSVTGTLKDTTSELQGLVRKKRRRRKRCKA